MAVTIAPNEDAIFTALRGFLIGVMPSGVDAFRGEQNRVPEPPASTFVVMWPLSRPRLSTNIDSAVDTAFMSSIAGTVLTVTELLIGTIRPGATLFGVGVADGSLIGEQLSPTTYSVSPSQTLTNRKMAAGMFEAMQPTEVVMQIDVHTPDLTQGGDIAATVATLWRDAYAVDQIAASNPAIAPLYAADPRQMPFLNGEQQYEIKWTVDLHMQVNQTVSGLPQQFFDATDLDLIDVDATFPAS